MCELNYCPHSQNFESEAFLLFAEKIGLAIGEDVMGWDDGTIWKIEEVVVKIAARLLPNQTLPDLHMSVGLWETVLTNSLEQTLYKEEATIWPEALQ